jgi:hypothetical protein
MTNERQRISDEKITQDLKDFGDFTRRFDKKFANRSIDEHLTTLVAAIEAESDYRKKQTLSAQLQMYHHLRDEIGAVNLGSAYTTLIRRRVEVEVVTQWARAGAFMPTSDNWGQGDIEGAMRMAVTIGYHPESGKILRSRQATRSKSK